MNPASLTASAAQAKAQGNQMLSSDQSNANKYQTSYNTDTSQAAAANKQVQNYTQYLQGAGSGQNVYNTQLGNLTQQYDPNLQAQLSGANKSLFQLTGALNGANQQFSQPGGVGAYGLSAPALAGYEGSVLQPLQQGVSNANTQVGTLNSQLGTLTNAANQATGAQVQSEQTTLQGYQNVYSNAQNQAAQAMSAMQSYRQLAQQQGGLNAQQQQEYAQSISALQTAQAAMVQANAAAQQAAAQSALLNVQTQAAKAAMANPNTSVNGTSIPQGATPYENSKGQVLGYSNPKTRQDVQLQPTPPQAAPKASGGNVLSSLLHNFAGVF